MMKVCVLIGVFIFTSLSFAKENLNLECRNFSGEKRVDLNLEIEGSFFHHIEEGQVEGQYRIVKYPRGLNPGEEGLKKGYSIEEIKLITQKIKLEDQLGILTPKATIIALNAPESTTPYAYQPGDIGLRILNIKTRYQIKIEKFLLKGFAPFPKNRYGAFYQVAPKSIPSSWNNTLRGSVKQGNRPVEIVLCRLSSL